MNGNRDSGIDLLKIISCLAVILIHVNYYFFVDEIYLPNLGINYIVESLINIIMRFSVPIFVMTSGALILSKKKNKQFKEFYKRSFYKIFLPTLIIMVPLSIIQLIYNVLVSDTLLEAVIQFLISITKGNFYNLWYMYMLVGLYLLTPFIIRIKEQISTNDYNRSVVFYMIWVVFSQIYTEHAAAFSVGVVFSYLGYYLLGDVLYSQRHLLKKSYVYWSLSGLIISIIVTFVARYMGITYYLTSPYSSFFSPTIVVISIVIFQLFIGIKLQKNVLSRIADLTFFIYLVHTVVLQVVLRIFYRFFHTGELLGIVIVMSLTTTISVIVALVYDSVWKSIQEYIRRKNV